MPEIVEPNSRKTGPLQQGQERPSDQIALSHWAALSVTKDKLLQISLSQHSLPMLTERHDGKGRKVYGPPGSRRLRLVEPKAAGHLLEGVAHVQNRAVEVDIDPFQPQ